MKKQYTVFITWSTGHKLMQTVTTVQCEAEHHALGYAILHHEEDTEGYLMSMFSIIEPKCQRCGSETTHQ